MTNLPNPPSSLYTQTNANSPYLIVGQTRFVSHSKVNLALDILRKMGTGYHEIQTVFQKITDLSDEIDIEETKNNSIEIASDNPDVPVDKTNTIFKAANLLKKNFSIQSGVRFFIKKKIPLMSGLGGGSSNAVTTLKSLAHIWNLPCCKDKKHTSEECGLRQIAGQIGMDCAFFFYGGTTLGEHFGEKITPLPPLPKEIKIELIKTGVKVSSKWAYEHIDLSRCGKNVDKTKKVIDALHEKNPQKFLENIHNDFEELIFSTHPSLKEKKQEIETSGSKVVLAGSGGVLAKFTIRNFDVL